MITIIQGVTEDILAKQLTDNLGAPLDPTGWTIHAVACQYSEDGPVVATWRNSPGEGDGQADVIDATDSSGTKWVALRLTPALTLGWTWSRGKLQCRITDPNNAANSARIIDDLVLIDPNCVSEG